MGKKAFWCLAILIVLAVAAYLAFTAGPPAAQTPPAVPSAPTPAAAPPPAPADDRQPAASSEARSGQMKLSDAPETAATAQPDPADYAYSLKKEHNERAIAPGVTYVPGEGVHIKTSGKDATIRITRDSTYPTSDYQVMWHKKY